MLLLGLVWVVDLSFVFAGGGILPPFYVGVGYVFLLFFSFGWLVSSFFCRYFEEGVFKKNRPVFSDGAVVEEIMIHSLI